MCKLAINKKIFFIGVFSQSSISSMAKTMIFLYGNDRYYSAYSIRLFTFLLYLAAFSKLSPVLKYKDMMRTFIASKIISLIGLLLTVYYFDIGNPKLFFSVLVILDTQFGIAESGYLAVLNSISSGYNLMPNFYTGSTISNIIGAIFGFIVYSKYKNETDYLVIALIFVLFDLVCTSFLVTLSYSEWNTERKVESKTADKVSAGLDRRDIKYLFYIAWEISTLLLIYPFFAFQFKFRDEIKEHFPLLCIAVTDICILISKTFSISKRIHPINRLKDFFRKYKGLLLFVKTSIGLFGFSIFVKSRISKTPLSDIWVGIMFLLYILQGFIGGFLDNLIIGEYTSELPPEKEKATGFRISMAKNTPIFVTIFLITIMSAYGILD